MRHRRPIATAITLLSPLLMMMSAVTDARAQGSGVNPFGCGPLNPPGQYGPFDYRTAPSDVKHRVEDFHFTSKVEQAIDGATGGFGGDIDYTLRAFPNNPRALLAISRYAQRHHQEKIPGTHYTTECYYERAFRYTPDDPMPHLIYAIYLKDRGRTGEVKQQLAVAEQMRGDQSNFDFDYNLGILYADVGDYDRAMLAARRAYELGAPLPALRNRLVKAGKWTETPSAPAAP